MRTLSASGGSAPRGPNAWTGCWSSGEGISSKCFAPTCATTDESQVRLDIPAPLFHHGALGAGCLELKSRIRGLFLPRCLPLAGHRDARPSDGARTLLARRLEVLHEPPVRLLGLGSDLPLQPVLGRRGEDADRVPVADPAGVSGGQLEEPDLLPDERGSGEGVVLLPGEQMPAQDGELSSHGHRGDVGASPRADPLAERPEW